MNKSYEKKMVRTATSICVIFILSGVILLPAENTHGSSFFNSATIISQVRTHEGMQEISIEIPVDEALMLQKKLRNESSDEKIFDLLRYYGLVPENLIISDIKKGFQSSIGENFMAGCALLKLINNTYGLDKKFFCNFLSYAWITFEYGYVISIGTSSPKGLLNFPLYLFGMLLSSKLFPQSMPLQLLLIHMMLFSSTDIMDIVYAEGGSIDYFIERPGRENVYFSKPLYAFLIGFHGVHITLIFPVQGGGYQIGHIFWGLTLATIMVPEQ